MKADPDGAGFDPGRLERLTALLEGSYVDPGRLPGCQVTVTRGSRIAYHRSFGWADRERRQRVADDTVWRIYSMTKPITSVALLQQYELGRCQLTDPVHRYIPEWRDLMVLEVGPDGERPERPPARPMQVIDALTHMTGLPGSVTMDHPTDRAYGDALAAAKSGMTLAGACALLARFPLTFDPGTRWNYGLSTDVCARLVEILSGQPFDRYLDEHLFGPLGMVDTGFSVPEHAAGRFAACYRYRRGREPELVDDPATSRFLRPRSYLSGAGGLVSTSGDYVRFCQMLLAGGELDGRRVLGRKTIDLMGVNHLPGDADLAEVAVGGFGEAGFGGIGFGLGFAVSRGPAHTKVAGSAGELMWGGYASTAFWVDRAEDVAVVLMTQLTPSAAYPLRAQLHALVYQALVG